jgi:hypothetical protein
MATQVGVQPRQAAVPLAAAIGATLRIAAGSAAMAPPVLVAGLAVLAAATGARVAAAVVAALPAGAVRGATQVRLVALIVRPGATVDVAGTTPGAAGRAGDGGAPRVALADRLGTDEVEAVG